MKKYQYITCCVNSDYDSITDMVDNSKEITRQTFFRHASLSDVYNIFCGIYNKQFPIKNDYHVYYFKSKYQGRPCYYLVHSCIEYVFC